MIERMTAIETSFENAMNTLGDRIELAVNNAVMSLAKTAEVEALKVRIEALETARSVQTGQVNVLAFWLDKALPWAMGGGGLALLARFAGA